MVYGARFLQALCEREEKLPYLDDNTPLPDGVMDFVKRACSYSDGGIVSEMQRQIGNMDVKASGLAADVLRLCGLNSTMRLYRRQE